jgi:hypothetical protein
VQVETIKVRGLTSLLRPHLPGHSQPCLYHFPASGFPRKVLTQGL